MKTDDVRSVIELELEGRRRADELASRRLAVAIAHMSLDVRDWAANRSDAYLYGIIVGWDDNTIAELRQKFDWPDEVVAALKNFRLKADQT